MTRFGFVLTNLLFSVLTNLNPFAVSDIIRGPDAFPTSAEACAARFFFSLIDLFTRIAYFPSPRPLCLFLNDNVLLLPPEDTFSKSLFRSLPAFPIGAGTRRK